MDNNQRIFWTGFALTIIGFFAAILFTVGMASAAQVSVAYGDNLTFSDNNAPYFIIIPSSQIGSDLNTSASDAALASTAQCQAWMFGQKVFIDPVPFSSHMSYYTVEIPASIIRSLPEGDYNMYLQFPGRTGALSLNYDNKTHSLVSPHSSNHDEYTTYFLYGLSSKMAEERFVAAQHDTSAMYGDTFIQVTVTVGKPTITVVNNYVVSNGDLYVGGTTNLAKGDRISGTIDPDIYVSPEYHTMMTDISFAEGDDKELRNWHLVFPQKLSNQLPIGHHEIVVDIGQDTKYSVPFNRWLDPVTPTPTIEVNDIYAVNGEWMGHTVNTTAPAETPVPVPTINKTYETVLAKFRLNNRTVDNRGDVYIGEKNLDVSGAIGWPQPNGDWVIQYCDYYGDDYNKTITIPNPRHFDVTRDIFANDYGAWCQYSTFEAGRARQPVAFWVRSDLPYVTPTETPVPPLNQTANVTVNETEPEVVVVTPTDVPTSLPAEPMASDTIVVPLPPWIAVAALVIIVWRRK